MNWIQRLALFGLMSTVSRAWAQAPSNPAPQPGLPAPADLPAGTGLPPVTGVPHMTGQAVDASTGFVLVSAVILLLLIVGIGVKLYDRKQKRDQEAAALQARISDALMSDPMLSRLPITATVRLPLWNGKPVMVEVTGTAPRPGLRQAAVDLALREALRTGNTCRIVDRVSVDPAMLRHAA